MHSIVAGAIRKINKTQGKKEQPEKSVQQASAYVSKKTAKKSDASNGRGRTPVPRNDRFENDVDTTDSEDSGRILRPSDLTKSGRRLESHGKDRRIKKSGKNSAPVNREDRYLHPQISTSEKSDNIHNSSEYSSHGSNDDHVTSSVNDISFDSVDVVQEKIEVKHIKKVKKDKIKSSKKKILNENKDDTMRKRKTKAKNNNIQPQIYPAQDYIAAKEKTIEEFNKKQYLTPQPSIERANNFPIHSEKNNTDKEFDKLKEIVQKEPIPFRSKNSEYLESINKSLNTMQFGHQKYIPILTPMDSQFNRNNRSYQSNPNLNRQENDRSSRQRQILPEIKYNSNFNRNNRNYKSNPNLFDSRDQQVREILPLRPLVGRHQLDPQQNKSMNQDKTDSIIHGGQYGSSFRLSESVNNHFGGDIAQKATFPETGKYYDSSQRVGQSRTEIQYPSDFHIVSQNRPSNGDSQNDHAQLGIVNGHLQSLATEMTRELQDNQSNQISNAGLHQFDRKQNQFRSQPSDSVEEWPAPPDSISLNNYTEEIAPYLGESTANDNTFLFSFQSSNNRPSQSHDHQEPQQQHQQKQQQHYEQQQHQQQNQQQQQQQQPPQHQQQKHYQKQRRQEHYRLQQHEQQQARQPQQQQQSQQQQPQQQQHPQQQQPHQQQHPQQQPQQQHYAQQQHEQPQQHEKQQTRQYQQQQHPQQQKPQQQQHPQQQQPQQQQHPQQQPQQEHHPRQQLQQQHYHQQQPQQQHYHQQQPQQQHYHQQQPQQQHYPQQQPQQPQQHQTEQPPHHQPHQHQQYTMAHQKVPPVARNKLHTEYRPMKEDLYQLR